MPLLYGKTKSLSTVGLFTKGEPRALHSGRGSVAYPGANRLGLFQGHYPLKDFRV
jgi:hypothetical protein